MFSCNIYKFVPTQKPKELLESSESDDESHSQATTSGTTSTVVQGDESIDSVEANYETDESEPMIISAPVIENGKLVCKWCLKQFATGGIKRHYRYCKVKLQQEQQ